ncbi:hypothetical protein DV736_g2747, partial [Chaetothyriales sp. CBS 134916]
MESLSEEVWDVVIAGTSLPQSLLALALSRSGKKVLHVDQNGYYGGEDTGFSLQAAEQWTTTVNAGGSTVFSDAAITALNSTTSPVSVLKSSRAYTLCLNPQIVYAQSQFLPTLVSSQIHSQLEFQAVGWWWIYRNGSLQKIPGTREDVFNDDSLSVRDKRILMKFLRYVLQEDDAQNDASAEALPPILLADALETRFRVPAALQGPIVALALSPQLAATTDLNYATARIRRHMRSAGYFGPGLGAVLAKYGGNAEISQVACRAQAVGGGVYLLGTGLKAIHAPSTIPQASVESSSLTRVELSDGTEIKARWVVGGVDDLPTQADCPPQDQAAPTVTTYHTIDIVSNPLQHLFPPAAENGHVPVVAIVLVLEDTTVDSAPIYLQVHSEDTGECPSGQSVIYGSVQSNQPNAVERLKLAVSKLLHLEHDPASEKPQSIWNMSYTSHQPAMFHGSHLAAPNSPPSTIVSLQTRPHDLALQDETLDEIKSVWTAILRDEAESQPFLRFEQREQDAESEGIINHYNGDHLADIQVFMHNLQYQWHNDDANKDGATHFCKAFIELSSERPSADDIPTAIAASCCAQFIVTKTKLRVKPLSEYVRVRDWVLNAPLPDDISGLIMEYSWHMFFGQPDVHWPEAQSCYCNVFGLCDLDNCTDKACQAQYTLPRYSTKPKEWKPLAMSYNAGEKT